MASEYDRGTSQVYSKVSTTSAILARLLLEESYQVDLGHTPGRVLPSPSVLFQQEQPFVGNLSLPED